MPATWKAKIGRFGPRRLKAPVPCGICEQPIRKGDELFTTLWTKGGEGCTTRRHANCDESQQPNEREIERHRQIRKGVRS